AVHPEKKFFLSALRLSPASINRLDGLKWLEVIGNVLGQIFEQSWAKADDQVDFSSWKRAVLAQFLYNRLNDFEIGTIDTAQMYVPLVLTHISIENCGLRFRHKILLNYSVWMNCWLTQLARCGSCCQDLLNS